MMKKYTLLLMSALFLQQVNAAEHQEAYRKLHEQELARMDKEKPGKAKNAPEAKAAPKKEKKPGLFKRMKNKKNQRNAAKNEKKAKKAEIKQIQQQTVTDEINRSKGRLAEEQRAQQIHNERKNIFGRMPARKSTDDISLGQRKALEEKLTGQDEEMAKKEKKRPAANSENAPKKPAAKPGLFGNMFKKR